METDPARGMLRPRERADGERLGLDASVRGRLEPLRAKMTASQRLSPQFPSTRTVLRYYCFSSGPPVLLTDDEARAWLKRTTQQEQHPTPHTEQIDLSQLHLFDVTLIEHARMLTFAERTALS
ncbi:hypothetical protein ACWCQ1_36220 [Streptomyces sp. NPDC002144]